MGSKRNKENCHVDRGKFKKRVSPNSCNKKPKRLSLSSSRIIKLKNLDSAIQSISAHAATCPGCLSSSNQAVSLLGETDRKGLASVLTARCNYCKEEINFQTSSKFRSQKGAGRWEHNLAEVWGQMSTGGGFTLLRESMSAIGVPVMTKKTFIDTCILVFCLSTT